MIQQGHVPCPDTTPPAPDPRTAQATSSSPTARATPRVPPGDVRRGVRRPGCARAPPWGRCPASRSVRRCCSPTRPGTSWTWSFQFPARPAGHRDEQVRPAPRCNLPDLKAAMGRLAAGPGREKAGIPSTFGNHDQPRSVSRFGDDGPAPGSPRPRTPGHRPAPAPRDPVCVPGVTSWAMANTPFHRDHRLPRHPDAPVSTPKRPNGPGTDLPRAAGRDGQDEPRPGPDPRSSGTPPGAPASPPGTPLAGHQPPTTPRSTRPPQVRPSPARSSSTTAG